MPPLGGPGAQIPKPRLSPDTCPAAGSKGSIHVKGAQLLPDQLSTFVKGRLQGRLGHLLRTAQNTTDNEEPDSLQRPSVRPLTLISCSI